MKKIKIINLITSLVIISFVAVSTFLIGCKDNAITNSSNTTTVSGTIDHWTLGNNITLKAEVYDTTGNNSMMLGSTTVSASGSFYLTLKNVPDNFLFPILFHPDSLFSQINVTINPSNTKSSIHYCLIFPEGVAAYGFNLYSGTINKGFIYRSNRDTTNSFFYSFYQYFNQNFTLNGYTIRSGVDTSIYNFSGVQGWNKVVVIYDNPGSFSTKVHISANEPAGGKWVYDWNSDKEHHKK